MRPGRDVTSTVPPWASMIDCTIDRPSPLVPSAAAAPAAAVPDAEPSGPVRAASARAKRAEDPAHEFGRDARAVVRHGHHGAAVGGTHDARDHGGPASVCLRALESRLASTWCSCVVSPRTVSGSSGSFQLPDVVRGHDFLVADGLDHQLRQVHIGELQGPGLRPAGPAGGGPPRGWSCVRTGSAPEPATCARPSVNVSVMRMSSV